MAASEQDLYQIWSWNSKIPTTIDGLVHEIISENASEHPESVAVQAWDGSWTYHDLDRISTQLAHLLHSKEHRDDLKVPVVLCFEKSKWTSIAMLGVMKAGGSSVALDVSQPAERLRSIIDQTGSDLILCTASTRDIAAELCGTANTVQLDVGSLCRDITAVLPPVSPDQTLFVTYTSGSTGRPKGACISHANVCSAVHYQGAKLGFSRHSKVLDFAPYSFDVAWSNMLQTFCAGATLCIPPTDDMYTNLASCIEEYGVSLLNVTPTILRTLDRQPKCLEDVLLSGEAADIGLLKRWIGKVRLKNTYGPAECTFKSTFAEVSPEGIVQPENIGNGHGAVLWIVSANDSSELVPVGVIGELWLEGPLVGQGYWNDAEKTESAFVQDPAWLVRGHTFRKGRSGRLYRTRDLARYNVDGSIAFVGRLDRQVKIHGGRVELGDVEHHFRICLECATREEVTVEALVPRGSESLILVVFSTCERPAGLDDKLTRVLPRYMIPSVYIRISGHLPRTATGKIDRKHLRERYAQYSHHELTRVAHNGTMKDVPRTAAEKLLRTLWAKALRVPAACIGTNDSFFHLGGDSIRAMRLISLAREQNLLFTVADVFRHPKLCDLAAFAENQDAEVEADTLKPFSLLHSLDVKCAVHEAAKACQVDVLLIEDMFPCTPLQEGLMSLTMQRPGDYVSVRSYELSNEIDIDRFQKAWQEVVAVTPILRTRIVSLERQLLQVVLREEPQWLYSKCSDFSDMRKEFGLGCPLARFVLDNHSDGRQTFSLLMHHAIVDGWSRNVLMDMLQKAYAGDVLPQSPPLQTFVKYIMDVSTSDAEAAWRQQFNGLEAPVFPALPSKDYRPRAIACKEHNIAELTWPVSDITAPTIIQVALAILLQQYTGSNDVVFGLTTSGRDAPVAGIEHMMGPTVATVPLRIMLDEHETVEKLLVRVQSLGLDIKPFEHIGLSKVRRLSAQAEQACSFQALLVVHPHDEVELPEGFEGIDTPDATDSGYASEDSETQSSAKNTLPMTASTNSASQDIDDGASTYGLMIACQLRHSGAVVTASFDPTLIDGATVQRMLRQLETVLRQLCYTQDWYRKTSDISAVSDQDLEDIRKWNRLAPESVPCVVHTILSDVAQEQPHALAVHAWDGDLTYGDLDDLSTQLAQSLISIIDIEANDVVPICTEKSMWTSVAILGVMKAGAATLVFDVTQPKTRLQSIIERVRPKVMLTSAASCSLAETLALDANVLRIQSLLEPAVPHDLPTVKPERALLLVFTSGSTGIPKGIVLDHQNFSSALVHQTAQLGFTKDTRTFDFASYAFDASYYNLFHTLYAGGCLCVPSEDHRHGDLSGSILRLKASFANLTPKVAELLSKTALQQLELLELSGETAQQTLVQRLRQHTKVRFAYGPAECSVMSTVSSNQATRSTIGRGVGTSCWVVDPLDSNALTPIGGIGELWLEGPLVGIEYLNEPDKTVAAFVHDPPWLRRACGRSGKTYRTGDLVRYNDSGDVVFVGRKDGQTKIRGQRVELNEVAYHVQQCLAEGGTEARILADVGVPSGYHSSQLVAFVVLNDAKCKTEEELTSGVKTLTTGIAERMSAVVPSCMVPSMFVPLPAVPLTTTGKIDRQFLRRTIEGLGAVRTDLCQTHEPPLTAAEQQLAAIWARVLRTDRSSIGRTASFWDLGGDSITAMSLLMAIRNEYGVELKVPMLTRRDTTIEKLRGRIEELQRGHHKPEEEGNDIRADLTGLTKHLQGIASHGSGAKVRKAAGQPSVAFLTGATGYLGTQILRELLTSRRFQKVVVLIRATDDVRGLVRIRESVQSAGWWSGDIAGRMEVWSGDLSKPQLELTAVQWRRLSGSDAHDCIDTVVHNGAAVHWTSDYAALKTTNVESTAQLIEAALQSRHIKRFVYISGGVSWNGREDSRLAEDGDISAYTKTKYASEQLVLSVADHPDQPRGKFCIMKPALIVGDATSGIANAGDFLWRYVRSCIRLRAFPREPAGSWLPVAESGKIAARVLDQAIVEEAEIFSTIESGMFIDSFWEAVQAALRVRLKRTNMAEWKIMMQDDIQQELETHPLWPLQQFLGRLGVDIGVLREGKRPTMPSQQERLARAVTRNVQYLQQMGLIDE